MHVKELGHIVLYVTSIDRSRKFYRDILGWNEVAQAFGGRAAVFSSGRTHHELLLIEVGEGATPIPAGRRVGMYHFGLKIGTTDDELKDAIQQLHAGGVQILSASDHTVTHSIYIADPDGNEIELYIDVQPEVWREDPDAIMSPVRALQL